LKKDKGPELYSKKSKIIIAVCVAAVIAVTALCIILIANGNKTPDKTPDTSSRTEDTSLSTDTEDVSPYKPVDTGVVTDGVDTSKAPTTESSQDSDTAAVRPDDTALPVDTGKETEPADTKEAPSANTGTDLGDGITLVSIEPYSGAFVEDGSDEPVDNIISIVIKNSGDKAVQMIDITVGTDNGDAHFTATTLLPNTSVVVLEKNRMAYPGADKFGAAKIAQIGRFLEEPSFYTDKFDVRGADGTISVRNLMQEDVTGKVVVFYKTVKDGKYFGGITYQATLKGGVPAGTTVLVNANHFRINDSRLMFVRYE